MTRRSRFLLPVVAIIAGAIAVAAAQYFGGDDADRTSPTPRPGITVEAVDLTSAPHVPASRTHTLTKEFDAVLDAVYTRAFVRTSHDPTPPPAASSVRGLRTLMTSAAFTQLQRTPGVFDLGELSVSDGRVSYKGIVTFQGTAIGALLKVDFIAHAVPVGASDPVANVHQFGTVELKRSHDRWYVSGFDLKLRSDPAPTPSPSS